MFVKKMMQYVPTIGWAWRFSDAIFLNRNWEEDKAVMETQIKEFFDYPYPVWVSISYYFDTHCFTIVFLFMNHFSVR